MAGAKTELFSRVQPGGVYTISRQDLTTGNIFFVDSGKTTAGGDTAGKGRNPDFPFLTADFAVGQCTPNNGDRIYLMPGHAETLSTAAALAIDVAGISLLGIGTRNTKPIFTITTGAVDAPINFAAESCLMDNVRILGGKAGGSNVAINFAASYNALRNMELFSSASNELGIGAGLGVITITDTSAAIQEVIFENLTYKGGAGNDESFITVADGSNGATNCFMEGCKIIGTFADDAIQLDQGTNVNTLWHINNSIIGNLGGNNIAITMDTAAVNFLTNSNIFGANSTTKPIVGAGASYVSNVWTCESGAAGGTALNQTVTNWGA